MTKEIILAKIEVYQDINKKIKKRLDQLDISKTVELDFMDGWVEVSKIIRESSNEFSFKLN